MGKNAKRLRKNKTGDAAADVGTAIPSPITRLPFELIAEILLYSTSPADILSLSHTCKHFCATLVENPVATFIWRHVRAQTRPPVPDPAKLGLSEPQLANLIYGGGNCVVRAPSPFALLVLTLCSRYAGKAHPICILRFPPGYASVETKRVVRKTSCQSVESTPRLLNLRNLTETNAKATTTPFPNMHCGCPGSSGRATMIVGNLHHSSNNCTD